MNKLFTIVLMLFCSIAVFAQTVVTGTVTDASSNEPIPGVPGTENGVLIFKILRNVLDAPDRGKVCIVGRNPDAIWFDDYEDRVIYDEAGLFEYSRVDKKKIDLDDMAIQAKALELLDEIAPLTVQAAAALTPEYIAKQRATQRTAAEGAGR